MTQDCVQEKGVDYCFNCADFPCQYLMPLADGAGKLPQNIKLYNLCLMKKIGLDNWIEQAADIRQIYFTKKIAIGEGAARLQKMADRIQTFPKRLFRRQS